MRGPQLNQSAQYIQSSIQLRDAANTVMCSSSGQNRSDVHKTSMDDEIEKEKGGLCQKTM